jgi:hypothetical protein
MAKLSAQRPGLMVLTALVVCACSPFSPQIYDWRAYERAMSAEALDGAEFNRLEAIKDMRDGLESMSTAVIPPGALLHLAYLMEEEGLSAEALALLGRERELFPESGSWIDKMLQAARRSPGREKRL